ncbi:MAG: carbohydrate ABC transporter permease [Chloroflexia bacterium]|jgi:trehalose transport system permease protein|nr:carbohydrate ABC transporter permease [Chloroflexia bacterium]
MATVTEPARRENPAESFLYRLRNSVFTLGFVLLAAFFVAWFVFPLYILFKVSVSQPQDVLTQRPPLLIQNFTWDHWERMFNLDRILPPLQMSLTVATGTAIMCILIAAPAAYAISRLPRGLRYGIVLALLFTRMFPEVTIATPIAARFYGWGLSDSEIGLILAHMIRNLPFVAWILVGTFQVIPVDLEEASQVDGAGRISTLVRIVFPLALPGIVVAAMFAWLDSWNDLLWAIYLLPSEFTLPRLTYYYAARGGFFDVATFSVILTIPVFFITLFLQRYIRTGYLSGAVKG